MIPFDAVVYLNLEDAPLYLVRIEFSTKKLKEEMVTCVLQLSKDMPQTWEDYCKDTHNIFQSPPPHIPNSVRSHETKQMSIYFKKCHRPASASQMSMITCFLHQSSSWLEFSYKGRLLQESLETYLEGTAPAHIFVTRCLHVSRLTFGVILQGLWIYLDTRNIHPEGVDLH